MERRTSRKLSLKARLALDEQAQQVPAIAIARFDKGIAINQERLQPSTKVGNQVAALPSLDQQFRWAPIGTQARVLSSESANRDVVDSMNSEARHHFDHNGTAGISHDHGILKFWHSLLMSCFYICVPIKSFADDVPYIANYKPKTQEVHEWYPPTTAISKDSKFDYNDILFHTIAHNKRMPSNPGPVPPHGEPTGTTALPCTPLIFSILVTF